MHLLMTPMYSVPTQILTPALIRTINTELPKLSKWFKSNKLSLNLKQKQLVLYTFRTEKPTMIYPY